MLKTTEGFNQVTLVLMVLTIGIKFAQIPINPTKERKKIPMKPLFGKLYDTMERTLDITKHQHSLISSNIANIDTPGYTTKEVSFKKTLKRVLGDDIQVQMIKTHSTHIGPSNNEIDYVLSDREGKKLDLDVEMAKLSQNNLRYRMAAEMLAHKFGGLKDLINKAGS